MKTIVVGMVLVVSGFGLFFANLRRRQVKKDEKDMITPGAVPTCSYLPVPLETDSLN